MKSTLRRTLALTLGSVALAVGLGVPTATPAAAADCTTVSSIRGTSSDAYWTQPEMGLESGTGFEGVTVSLPAFCSSGTWRYQLEASFSGGSEYVTSSSSTYSRTGTTRVAFPSMTVDTPGGSGTMTLTVTPRYYNGAFWVSREATEFYVSVPGSFDSAVGTGMASGGSCSAGGPVYGTAKWC